MSRTEIRLRQNIFSCIHITIMHTATFRASPLSYSKACDTFRPRIGQRAAIRAGLGGKTFIDLFIPRAMPNGLVRKHVTEGRPAGIKNGLCQAGFGEAARVDISNSDVVELPNDANRELVVEIFALICNLRMDCFNAQFLVGALSHGKCILRLPIKALRINLFTVRQRGEFFQAQVDTNTSHRTVSISEGLDLNHDVDEPIAPRVLGEICTVLDFSSGEWPGAENAESIAAKSKRIAYSLEVLPFNGNPSEALTATVSEVWPISLSTRPRILLTNRVNCAGVEAEFLATTSSKVVQIEPSQPFTSIAQRILLPIVTVIPDVINRASLFIKEAS